MPNMRRAKIVATLGPSSDSEASIEALLNAGADVFRLNFSHGTHEQHALRMARIRAVERRVGRPIGVLQDLQGPKLRIGVFQAGPVTLKAGDGFRLSLAPVSGDQNGVQLPHPEIFKALVPGTDLLINDGKVRLRVVECSDEHAQTTVVAGGVVSDRKGVNVPQVVLPLSALTEKDRLDLQVGLDMGVDWVALSFVQRPEDMAELRALVQGRAGVLAKIEKPSALDSLDQIVALSDAIMVARGDLGVELPAQRVPRIQKEIIRVCREQGRPVIVATQMLESMIEAPVPTRAEASDVATAVYDGADAVMLSAESASGAYPVEAVTMMNSIINEVELDPAAKTGRLLTGKENGRSVSDVVCRALRVAADELPLAGVVTYTRSGASSVMASRERPNAPILSVTPDLGVARRLCLAWGVRSIHSAEQLERVPDIVGNACHLARQVGLAAAGDLVAVAAGTPFGTVGSTNYLQIAKA